MLVNARVEILCDNEGVGFMVNDYATNCPKSLKLLRILTLDNLRHNRRVFVKHIKTDDNILPDSLSRLDFKRFWKNALKNMCRFPDPIPTFIWPI